MAMFIDRLLSGQSGPVLEKVIEFTAARHRLIAQNIASVDAGGYIQKDLSVKKFQKALSEHIERRDSGIEGRMADMRAAMEEIEEPVAGILNRDGNNRSMEQLASDLAKNGLLHNVAIELLRKQFQQFEMALKERVS